MSNELTERFKDIVIDSPLVGDILLNCRREITEKIPTLAVGPATQKGGFKLMINEEFFNTLDEEEQRAVVFHEISHLVSKHLKRFYEQFSSQSTAYLANIACDCAINQFNRYRLPENCVTLKSLQDMLNSRGDNITLKEKETAEYYYLALQDEVNKRKEEMQECVDGQEGDGEGQGSGSSLEQALKDYAEKNNSDHEGASEDMSKMNPLDQAALDSIIKKAIDKQKQHDLKRGTGAGGSILDILPQDKIKLHKRIWENLLNKVLDGETPSGEQFEIRYGRPNRRNKFSVYGKKRLFEDQTVYIGVDTSASVSDAELSAFIGHINKALKGQDLIIKALIHCDYEIAHIDHHLKRISKKKGLSIHGRGGTDLTKITDYILEQEGKKKCDLILLTDGETPWKEYKNINTNVIYTPRHSKIEGVRHEAVLELPDQF